MGQKTVNASSSSKADAFAALHRDTPMFEQPWVGRLFERNVIPAKPWVTVEIRDLRPRAHES